MPEKSPATGGAAKQDCVLARQQFPGLGISFHVLTKSAFGMDFYAFSKISPVVNRESV
ncbi:MAG: hypothetical protein ACOY2B_07700 [Pseudomonadota bacterium]